MSVTLNGTTQYFSGGPTFTTLPTNWSIAAWVQVTGFAAIQLIAGVTNSGGWGLSIPDSGRIRNTWYTVNDYDSDAITLSANTWVHVLVVKAGSTLSYYVNATARGTDALGTYVSGGAQGIYLGARNSSGSAANFLGGKLAEVAIWDSDVSGSVATLCSGAATGAAPNTVGTPAHYWPLVSDGTATLGGFDLTAQASPTFASHATDGLTITGGGGGSSTTPPPFPRFNYAILNH